MVLDSRTQRALDKERAFGGLIVEKPGISRIAREACIEALFQGLRLKQHLAYIMAVVEYSEEKGGLHKLELFDLYYFQLKNLSHQTGLDLLTNKDLLQELDVALYVLVRMLKTNYRGRRLCDFFNTSKTKKRYDDQRTYAFMAEFFRLFSWYDKNFKRKILGFDRKLSKLNVPIIEVAQPPSKAISMSL